MSSTLFDWNCTRIETAIRAIWMLWRRGAWTQLNEIGLTVEAIDEEFTAYDLQYVSGEHGRLRSDSQSQSLLNFLSDECKDDVLSSAMTLIMLYSLLFQKEIEQDAYISSTHQQKHTTKRHRRHRGRAS